MNMQPQAWAGRSQGRTLRGDPSHLSHPKPDAAPDNLLSDGRDIGNIPFQVSKRTLTQISSSRETAPSMMALVICLLVQGWIQGLTYTSPPLCHWATPYPDLMVCRTLKFFLIFFVLSARKINMQTEPTQTMFPRVAPFLIHLAHVYLV